MYQQYINGKLVDGLGKPLDVLDPSTGEVVGTVGSANAAQAQQALDAARALPVIDTPPLYAGENGLSALEASLNGQTIAAPPAFDNSWRSEAAALADRVVAEEITPQAAWDALKDALNAGTAP